MSKKTCIIVPCYNEAERLDARAFLDYLACETDIDYCFVNDGSTDATAELLQNLNDIGCGRIHVVDAPVNGGKAEAVRLGVNYAVELNEYDLIGFMDADLATPLEEMSRLKDEFYSCYVAVIGSRIKRLGAAIDRKLMRHYTGRLFATAVSFLFRFNAYDTQCGAKIFDVRMADLIFKEKFISKWLFDVELLLRIQNAGRLKEVKEIPLNIWTEQGGSKIKFVHLLRIPRDLLRIYFKNKRR
ncbi:glycosyltransferase [Porphyromonadaceae bacterium OttesenSCG-928-L07]|nr:glycosyltransferase [Porphyromonadaceae bacterium OttesenSCG-928-L07]